MPKWNKSLTAWYICMCMYPHTHTLVKIIVTAFQMNFSKDLQSCLSFSASPSSTVPYNPLPQFNFPLCFLLYSFIQLCFLTPFITDPAFQCPLLNSWHFGYSTWKLLCPKIESNNAQMGKTGDVCLSVYVLGNLTQKNYLHLYSFACELHNFYLLTSWIIFHDVDVLHFLFLFIHQFIDVYVVLIVWLIWRETLDKDEQFAWKEDAVLCVFML